MSLNKLRSKINALDARIVQLLNTRADVILAVAQEKARKGLSVYSPDREQEVLRRVTALSKGPLDREGVQAIYREIMSASLALEKPLKIAYLGPEASFTHLASLKRFGSRVEYVACESIAGVFSEVHRGRADFGVVPVENSIEGAVSHTLDMFVDTDLQMCAQIMLDVSHNLLARCSLAQVKKVYSNPQVFGQCRQWLQVHLPHADLVDAASTTRAAQIAAREKNAASIASLLAAKVYGLKVLAKDIEDSPHNVTRFMVIGTQEALPTGNDKTSIMFSIKDRVGALHQMLMPFKAHRINLTKIESRPSKKKAWEYVFFVDFIGHRNDARVKKALAALEPQCNFLKILGSYPVGV
jgi:chorismate mutase/prephenate dehydratase